MANKKNGVHEYKDNSGENRMHVWESGNITIGSTEGYKNKSDMKEAAINGALTILEHYDAEEMLSDEQLERLINLSSSKLWNNNTN